MGRGRQWSVMHVGKCVTPRKLTGLYGDAIVWSHTLTYIAEPFLVSCSSPSLHLHRCQPNIDPIHWVLLAQLHISQRYNKIPSARRGPPAYRPFCASTSNRARRLMLKLSYSDQNWSSNVRTASLEGAEPTHPGVQSGVLPFQSSKNTLGIISVCLTFTLPPSSNGPTSKNQLLEQNHVGMMTVGP